MAALILGAMNIEPIHPNRVAQLWPQIADLLASALVTGGGEYNADQLKVMLVQGQQALLVVASPDGAISGALTVAFENYPNDRIAFVTSVGGKMICDADAWQQFEDWARQHGATKIRGYAHKSVARLWRQKFGVEQRYLIVEKPL